MPFVRDDTGWMHRISGGVFQPPLVVSMDVNPFPSWHNIPKDALVSFSQLAVVVVTIGWQRCLGWWCGLFSWLVRSSVGKAAYARPPLSGHLSDNRQHTLTHSWALRLLISLAFQVQLFRVARSRDSRSSIVDLDRGSSATSGANYLINHNHRQALATQQHLTINSAIPQRAGIRSSAALRTG